MYPLLPGQRRLRKLGNTMWQETEEGLMKPQDLENLSENDLRGLDKVHTAVTMYRKLPPVLSVIANIHWDDIARIKPQLMETLDPRAGSRDMKASGDWETFWNTLN